MPLLAAGGTRLKILEAAACGVPVVSTSVGAEGLEFDAEREIRLHDEPRGVRGGSGGAARRPRGRAAAGGRGARARVETLYDWARIGREFAGELARRAAARA